MTDYIEREAAKNILLQHQHRFTCADEANGYGSVKWSEDVIYLSEAVNGMDAIPAADVRPVRRGKWKRVVDFTGVEAFGFKETMVVGWGCNVCGYEVDVSEESFRFCPNCGADMRPASMSGANEEES